MRNGLLRRVRESPVKALISFLHNFQDITSLTLYGVGGYLDYECKSRSFVFREIRLRSEYKNRRINTTKLETAYETILDEQWIKVDLLSLAS